MNRYVIVRVIYVIAVIVGIVAVGATIWANATKEDQYALSERKIAPDDKVSVDFSDESTILTPAQKSELQQDLLARSTKKVPEGTAVTATIRESSVQRISDNEIRFIIDSSELQTSYLISRFISPEDNLDIININCVEESQKIYKQDYCYVE